MNAIACPHCAGHIAIAQQHLGQTVGCPHCQGLVQVPWPAIQPGNQLGFLAQPEYQRPTTYFEEHPKKEFDPDEPVRCPNCQSTQLTTNAKGFRLGKAAVGLITFGALGLFGGVIGSSKVVITCMKCGKRFSPGS